MRGVEGVLLAAGSGSRLQVEVPKAMVEIEGLPLLAYGLAGLKSALCEKRVVAVVRENPGPITSYFGDQMEYVLQQDPMGNAHALYAAAIKSHAENLFVAHGDDCLFLAMRPEVIMSTVRVHLEKQADVTVLLVKDRIATIHGHRYEMDAGGRVIRIVRADDFIGTAPSGYFSGALIVRRASFMSAYNHIPSRVSHSGRTEVGISDMFRMLVTQGVTQSGGLYGHLVDVPWQGINTRDDLETARRMVQNRL